MLPFPVCLARPADDGAFTPAFTTAGGPEPPFRRAGADAVDAIWSGRRPLTPRPCPHDPGIVGAESNRHVLPMTVHRPAAKSFATSAPITSAQLWLIVAWVMAGGALVQHLGRAAGVGGTATKNVLAIGFYGVIVLWILWLRRRNGLDVPRLLGAPPTRLSTMLAALAGPSLALVWLGLWTPLYGQAVQGGPTAPPPPPDGILDWGHPASAMLRLGILVGISPAVEEVLFRGILLNRVTETLGAPTAGVLVALLFAVAHVSFLPALCLAVLLTALYRRTGSLWISIGAHSLYNALVAGWAAAIAWQHSPNGARMAWPTVLWIGRAALIAGVIGLVLVFRALPTSHGFGMTKQPDS